MTESTRIYDVPSISCNHCKQSIEGGLSQVDGISAVNVDVPTRRVRVEGPIDEDAVREVLVGLGFEVEGSVLA